MKSKDVILSDDLLNSEMEELMGGVKVKVKITTKDGTVYEAEIEI